MRQRAKIGLFWKLVRDLDQFHIPEMCRIDEDLALPSAR